MVSTTHFTCIGKGHGAPAIPATRKEWEELRNAPWLAEMCRRIAAGDESLKAKLPVWTPGCAEFKNNHRALADALKPLRRLMLDFDEKGHSAEILAKAMELQAAGRWKILLVEESVRRGTHVLIALPEGMTPQEAQLRFSNDIGFVADPATKDIASRCIYMVPKENTLFVSLAPITEEVEGTFVNDGKFSSFGEGQYDFYYNETAVYKNIGGKAVAFSVEKCTMNVTVAENGDMNVVATIIASDAVQYEVTMTSKYNEYLDYDATEGAIDRTYNATDSVLLETYDNDNAAYMEITAADGSDLCALYFIVEDFDDAITIQPGMYTISKSLDAMTVLASVGAVDNSPYPSFYAKQNAQGNLVAPLYFMVGGTVEVKNENGNLYIEVNAVNSYEVPMHIVYDATPTTGIENVGAEMMDTEKKIENGQLLIIRNGKAYNALGAKVK